MKLSKEHSAAPEHPPMATPPGPNGIRVGIDLGGTKIEIIGLAQDQRVVLQKRFSTPRGRYRAIIEALAAAVEFAEFNTKETLHRPLGLGTPGAVSHKTGRMKNCNTTELNGRDLVKDLIQVLQRPVKIANDADCFTLSEAIDGCRPKPHRSIRSDPRHWRRRRPGSSPKTTDWPQRHHWRMGP